MPYRLAGVFAHPDDDTYGLGGTLALHADEMEYMVVIATSGEAGQIADQSLATRESLGQVREVEEHEALRTLGVESAGVHYLRYPDGQLSTVPREELERRIVEELREVGPDVVVTFGPEGITKHPDHTTACQAATDAFHEARAGGEGGLRRLLYIALPQSLVDRFWHALRERGVDLGSPEAEFMPRGVPDHTITIQVDCSAVLPRKLEAIRAHRTQSEELDTIPQDLMEDFLGREYFVQAWPPVTDPGGPTLTSIFEGLEG